jgi:precorrin-6B methylase 2
MSYLSVASHRRMALDARRNGAYYTALAGAIRSESVVLDLGAGTGVHGLMAARLGARRVYLVEPEDIIAVADEMVRANSLEHVVQCLQGRIEDVRLPEPVDVIVSVLTGNFLLTEDLLPSLLHARTSLKPGGTLIPSAASMEAVPVSAPGIHGAEVAGWSQSSYGVDLSSARPYAANTVYYRGQELRAVERLADPRILHTLDLTADPYESVQIAATYDITRSGDCHGWIGWLNLRLGDRWLSTSPDEPVVHWSTAYLPLDPPMTFERGERVSFTLHRAPFGDWTWSVTAASGAQHHSTLLSSPMTEASLDKARTTYAPALNDEGRLIRDLLAHFDGRQTVEAVARHIRAQHPQRFSSDAEALTLVHRVVKRYA